MLNTDRFGSVVSRVVKDPAVTKALASYVTDETMKVLNLQGAIRSILPDRYASAASILTSALRSFVQTQVSDVLAVKTVRSLMVSLSRKAHRALLHLLQGNGLRGAPSRCRRTRSP